MPPPDHVQSELVSYLDWFKRKQETDDRRSDENRIAIMTLTTQMQLLSGKLDTVNAVIEERLKGHAARLDALEDAAEDTGVHNLARLKDERDNARSNFKLALYFAAATLGGSGAGAAIMHALH